MGEREAATQPHHVNQAAVISALSHLPAALGLVLGMHRPQAAGRRSTEGRIWKAMGPTQGPGEGGEQRERNPRQTPEGQALVLQIPHTIPARHAA